jgi:CubicO group peptidase (beta-lactamase class C family)
VRPGQARAEGRGTLAAVTSACWGPRARVLLVLLAAGSLAAACAQAVAPPVHDSPACACAPSSSAPAAGAAEAAASAAGLAGATPQQKATREPRAPTRSTAVRFEPGLPEAGFLPRGEPAELGVSGGAVDALVKEAEATHSDALIVVRSGKVIIERYFGRARAPLETMSITKSLSSLAVGLLIEEGKIASVDAPLSTWFPEWREGKKARVTLRHVLTQTTGVQRKPGIKALNAQKDRLAYARRLSVEQAPGEAFFYSNEATQLLAGVVEAAAHAPLDAYLQRRVFGPLGIREFMWAHDRAGKPQAYFGVALHARDLARVALMMLNEGRHEGRQILPAAWVHQSTSPGLEITPQYGLLWWLRRDSPWHTTQPEHLDRLREQGLAGADRLLPLVGRQLAGAEAWWGEAGALLDADGREELAALARRGFAPFSTQPGRQTGFYSDGSRGQKLGVFPGRKIVAVRQHHSEPGDDDGSRYGFAGFHAMVEALAPEDGGAP